MTAQELLLQLRQRKVSIELTADGHAFAIAGQLTKAEHKALGALVTEVKNALHIERAEAHRQASQRLIDAQPDDRRADSAAVCAADSTPVPVEMEAGGNEEEQEEQAEIGELSAAGMTDAEIRAYLATSYEPPPRPPMRRHFGGRPIHDMRDEVRALDGPRVVSTDESRAADPPRGLPDHGQPWRHPRRDPSRWRTS